MFLHITPLFLLIVVYTIDTFESEGQVVELQNDASKTFLFNFLGFNTSTMKLGVRGVVWLLFCTDKLKVSHNVKPSDHSRQTQTGRSTKECHKEMCCNHSWVSLPNDIWKQVRISRKTAQYSKANDKAHLTKCSKTTSDKMPEQPKQVPHAWWPAMPSKNAWPIPWSAGVTLVVLCFRHAFRVWASSANLQGRHRAVDCSISVMSRHRRAGFSPLTWTSDVKY